MSERENKNDCKNMDALKKATPVESYQDILIRAFLMVISIIDLLRKHIKMCA